MIVDVVASDVGSWSWCWFWPMVPGKQHVFFWRKKKGTHRRFPSTFTCWLSGQKVNSTSHPYCMFCSLLSTIHVWNMLQFKILPTKTRWFIFPPSWGDVFFHSSLAFIQRLIPADEATQITKVQVIIRERYVIHRGKPGTQKLFFNPEIPRVLWVVLPGLCSCRIPWGVFWFVRFLNISPES